MIHTAMNEFGKVHSDYTAVPMSVCSAMSQGYIGYDIQNAIRTELLRRGIFKPVSTIITQVTVDPYDDAFHEPVKVIGRVLTEEEAELEEQKGNYVTKVEGGYRRIVAAPKPQDVVEIDAIRTLSDAGQIVIACGGGGIPVLEQQASLNGASAVIEKDLVSGKLAELLDAEELLILTSVEKVSLNYQSDKEEKIEKMDVETAKKYMQENQFGASTMLPKVEAAVSFVEKKAGRKAVITSIDRAKDLVSLERPVQLSSKTFCKKKEKTNLRRLKRGWLSFCYVTCLRSTVYVILYTIPEIKILLKGEIENDEAITIIRTD